ncbi:MAG: single-stranded DNA-binding protein [Acidimicrobiia bacterium]|nr:single-stranded DNA-binding protein [Acidimicrobiia bacterium]
MDLNLVVLGGRLAAPPELRVFESGVRLVRYLVTVKSDEPRRRVDVLPVTVWDPEDEIVAQDPQPGHRLWLAGSAQRRFWDGDAGRRSRIEIVAGNVTFRDPESLLPDPIEK